jgi:hypothetical protein
MGPDYRKEPNCYADKGLCHYNIGICMCISIQRRHSVFWPRQGEKLTSLQGQKSPARTFPVRGSHDDMNQQLRRLFVVSGSSAPIEKNVISYGEPPIRVIL